MKPDIIVLAGSFVMPDGNALAVYYTAFAKLLEAIGYRVIYISWKHGIDAGRQGYVKTEYERRECYEIPYPVSVQEWMKNIINSRIYKIILKDIGIEEIYAVMVDGIKAYNIGSLYQFCRKNRICYIYHLSEWPKEPIDSTLNSKINVLSAWIEMNVLSKKIKNVISVSQFAADQLNKHRGMNAVQIPVFTDKDAPKWKIEKRYIPTDIIKVGYAGNLDRIGYKERIDWLVQAACEINQNIGKKIEVHIIGITKTQFKKVCPIISLSQFFDETVIFYGRKTQRECIQIIGQMDYSFIVRNATWNMCCGFPTKLGESFACGVPVLISDYGDNRNFVENGKTGWLLEDITYEGLLNLLKKITCQEDEERTAMHSAAFQTRILDYRYYQEKIGKYLTGV